jgi:hypothetical protein
MIGFLFDNIAQLSESKLGDYFRYPALDNSDVDISVDSTILSGVVGYRTYSGSQVYEGHFRFHIPYWAGNPSSCE